ncbi:hypothetical protein JXR01_02360 [Candidatus Kaiserbacteria bacterium]|nr:MAG: hypothetical protein JXR01_02360 [Candidatus Kaiserbacteria bacterium]
MFEKFSFKKELKKRGGRHDNSAWPEKTRAKVIERIYTKQNKQEIKENPDAKESLEKFKEELDYALLWGILEEVARKSGVDTSVLNKISLDKQVIITPEGSAIGAYHPDMNKISFSSTHLRESSKAALIHTFVHELIHATSYIETEGLKARVGYDQGEGIGAAFNEGVTERLAQQVSMEYAKRSGISKEMAESVTNALRRTYVRWVAFVADIASRIDTYAGVQEGTAWRGMVRGMFEGEFLNNPEFEEFFRNSYGEDFVEAFKKIPTKHVPIEDQIDFDAQFRMRSYYTDEGKEILRKWVEHLGFERM